ncbi:Hypothetical protein GSB_151315, partial [Giardia duodenalis]
VYGTGRPSEACAPVYRPSASIQAGPALAAVRDGRHTGRRAAPRSALVHYQGVQRTASKFWGLQLHQVKGIVNGLEKISVL